MKEKIIRGLWLSVATALSIMTCVLLKMIVDGSLVAVVITPFAALVAMNIFEYQLKDKGQ